MTKENGIFVDHYRTRVTEGKTGLAGLLVGLAMFAGGSNILGNKPAEKINYAPHIIENGNSGGYVSLSRTEDQNYKTTDFSTDSDEVLLARLIFGEARGESRNSKIEVAYTAIERATNKKKWDGENLRQAILKKYQYSCFNEGDPNRVKLMDPQKYDNKSWNECLNVANEVVSKKVKPKFNGADHYHTRNTSPAWTKDSSKMQYLGQEGNHKFYRAK